MKLAYQAFDQSGRAVNGTIDSTDSQSATEALRQKGLFVTDISAAGSESHGRSATARKGRAPKLKDVAVFTRQLQVLLASGTPLVDALGALIRQSKPGLWRHINDLPRRLDIISTTALKVLQIKRRKCSLYVSSHYIDLVLSVL